MFCKKGVKRLHIVNIGWPALEKNFILTRDCFSQFILGETGAGWFSQEVRCSGARFILRKDALHRTIYYQIEHFDLPRYCTYLRVSSLKVKKSVINFLESKQIPQRNTSVSQKNLQIFTTVLNFERVLWLNLTMKIHNIWESQTNIIVFLTDCIILSVCLCFIKKNSFL